MYSFKQTKDSFGNSFPRDVPVNESTDSLTPPPRRVYHQLGIATKSFKPAHNCTFKSIQPHKKFEIQSTQNQSFFRGGNPRKMFSKKKPSGVFFLTPPKKIFNKIPLWVKKNSCLVYLNHKFFKTLTFSKSRLNSLQNYSKLLPPPRTGGASL